MCHLTAEQLVIVGKLLDAQQCSLVVGIDQHVAVLETTTRAGDMADQAEIERVRDRQLAAIDHDLRVLHDIEAARARLAAGDVNRCLDCGDEIGFDRLRVQPTAARCVYCQDAYEQAHRLAFEVVG